MLLFIYIYTYLYIYIYIYIYIYVYLYYIYSVASQHSSGEDLLHESPLPGPQPSPSPYPTLSPSTEGGSMREGETGGDSSATGGNRPNYEMTATPATAGRP
jgi:hypothetical protein